MVFETVQFLSNQFMLPPFLSHLSEVSLTILENSEHYIYCNLHISAIKFVMKSYNSKSDLSFTSESFK